MSNPLLLLSRSIVRPKHQQQLIVRPDQDCRSCMLQSNKKGTLILTVDHLVCGECGLVAGSHIQDVSAEIHYKDDNAGANDDRSEFDHNEKNKKEMRQKRRIASLLRMADYDANEVRLEKQRKRAREWANKFLDAERIVPVAGFMEQYEAYFQQFQADPKFPKTSFKKEHIAFGAVLLATWHRYDTMKAGIWIDRVATRLYHTHGPGVIEQKKQEEEDNEDPQPTPQRKSKRRRKKKKKNEDDETEEVEEEENPIVKEKEKEPILAEKQIDFQAATKILNKPVDPPVSNMIPRVRKEIYKICRKLDKKRMKVAQVLHLPPLTRYGIIKKCVAAYLFDMGELEATEEARVKRQLGMVLGQLQQEEARCTASSSSVTTTTITQSAAAAAATRTGEESSSDDDDNEQQMNAYEDDDEVKDSEDDEEEEEQDASPKRTVSVTTTTTTTTTSTTVSNIYKPSPRMLSSSTNKVIAATVVFLAFRETVRGEGGKVTQTEVRRLTGVSHKSIKTCEEKVLQKVKTISS
jgi:hypothetical protein